MATGTPGTGRFIVRRSKPGRGYGLFARAPMKRGDFILEYTGIRIPTKQADELKTKYLFEIDEHWTVDGSPRTNTARYINHSCKPNCEADVVDGKVVIHAARVIFPGEELTMDYGDEYFDEFIKPYGCQCDSCLRVGAGAIKTSR
jgi:SET domain-containing protein